MVESLSVKDKILMALYHQGVKGLREQLVAGLPRRTVEWAKLAREVLTDWESEQRAMVIRQLVSPGFVEHHPCGEELVAALQELISDGSGDERRLVVRFVSDNLRLFPVRSDTFQLKVMALTSSPDPLMAVAADDLLEKLGIDLRDPALLGDSHDAMGL